MPEHRYLWRHVAVSVPFLPRCLGSWTPHRVPLSARFGTIGLRDPYRWRAVALAWAVLVLGLTLAPDLASPGRESPAEVGRWCLICGERGAADAILNVLLFLPLGWAVARWRGVWVAVVVGAALSGTIELLQGGIAGRFSTAGDVVFNTLGAALGAAASGWVRRGRSPVPVLTALSAIGLVAPFALLAPAPTDGVYYGQWTARFGNLEPYEGRVLAATLGGVAMASRAVEPSEPLHRAFRERALLVVTFVVGPAPDGLAPVFSVYDHQQNEILLLGVDGDDLRYLPRTRSVALRLDRPDLVAPDALAGFVPGDTVVATVAVGPRRHPCISLNRRTTCDVAPGFAAGWSLLMYPLPLPGTFWNRLADLVWAAALAAPLGWLARRPMRALTLSLPLVALLLGASAAVVDLAVTPLPALALVLSAVFAAELRQRVDVVGR